LFFLLLAARAANALDHSAYVGGCRSPQGVSEVSSFAVDLTNCDREPIQFLGGVQSFGFLVAVTSDWMVARASQNLEVFTGAKAADLLGRPLTELFEIEAIHAIRNRITLLRGPDVVERLFGLTLVPGQPPFDVALHFSGSAIVIEAEPASDDAAEAANQIRTLTTRLTQADTKSAFLRDAARQVRAITGFDRVMVYRFDHAGSGEVVAEALRPGVDSFLGLNYPASDIPAQARALYLRNIFRVIADVDSAPSPIVPALDETGAPLDQSLSVLRSVSPIHIEYLHNMGVRASLSISIIVAGRLWGLFACHHYAPLLPSFAQRSAAELYGQMFSLMLESRERQEAREYEAQARAVTDRMMAAIAQDADLLTRAQWLGEMIMETIPADGVGVVIDGAVSLSGLTPNREQFLALLPVLNQMAASEVFTTDCLADHAPGAERYAHVAAGLLAIPISRSPRDYVMLFRSERLRTVRWAGNPEKPVEYGPNGARLTPRKSFEEWSELVRGKAQPFTVSELQVARAVRTALLEVVLRLSEEAGQERRRAHEQQQLLIAELNHRVRNILALIRGLVSQTRRSEISAEDFVATLDSRIQALARAHDQITTHRWGPGRLVELVEAEAGAYLGVRRDRLRLDGPDVLIDPTAFTVLALVFHELITNAAKYGALSDSGHIRLSWEVSDDGALRFAWREVGGPPVTAPTRRGFGTTIIERSIPFELSGSAEPRYLLGGFEADFCVPSRYVAGVRTEPAAVAAPAPATRQQAGVLAGRRVLLVEDSMLVALDAEDALRALGADDVLVAPSLSAAERLIDARLDLAVLDFNLGHENSLPLAERLDALGVPFILATGYGEDLVLPETLAQTPVVTKPYDEASLARRIGELGVGEAPRRGLNAGASLRRRDP
jgi:light-regulated signal transduction histidine kinase (bacteriophytochrome)